MKTLYTYLALAIIGALAALALSAAQPFQTTPRTPGTPAFHGPGDWNHRLGRPWGPGEGRHTFGANPVTFQAPDGFRTPDFGMAGGSSEYYGNGTIRNQTP